MGEWSIAGTYLESCNCQAICPCRDIGGRPGGASTYGVCEGAMSWLIERGEAGGIVLDGLAVVLALRYDEDEPGSPWDVVLYLDQRADAGQRGALEAIFMGASGGTPLAQFPWVWKDSRRHAVRAVPIEVEHHARRRLFRAGSYVDVIVGDAVAGQEEVTCGIPGHERPGIEYHGESLLVQDAPLRFEVSGRCAYQSTFEYASA